jgi:hypothetical protein
VRYTNRTTGGDVMPTLRTEFHRLAPNTETAPRREVGSSVRSERHLRSCPTPSPAAEAHFPVVAVAGHGLLAVTTVVLVPLVAAGVGS